MYDMNVTDNAWEIGHDSANLMKIVVICGCEVE